ncbi:MAG: hypothetical protein JNN00_14930 [Chitinophagaceae bacterium]|nr:hypothetical protein [Chitinophagaceae bacterium]
MKPILLLSILFLLFSCSEYPCSKAEIPFGLIGFSDTESDTIILRRYYKGNNPALKDSFLITDIVFERMHDSLKMVASPGTAILESQYDYDLFFPETGTLLYISAIQEEQLYMKRNRKVGCLNRISSFKINDQLSTNPDQSGIAWLHR